MMSYIMNNALGNQVCGMMVIAMMGMLMMKMMVMMLVTMTMAWTMMITITMAMQIVFLYYLSNYDSGEVTNVLPSANWLHTAARANMLLALKEETRTQYTHGTWVAAAGLLSLSFMKLSLIHI